jgi:CDP-diacylglycerol--serine O-phosphatidyltransferase
MADPAPPRRRRRRRPRWERDEAGPRGFTQLLPHLFTTGNLAGGFYAIVKAAHGDVGRAALAVLVAAICDALDGRVARLAGATSRFGAEYDSIADTVSFGVAPAVIAWSAGSLYELGWTGWVLAFLYTACAALRLARFNVSPGRFPGRFEGLPSPAAAGMVISTVWFAGFMRSLDVPIDPPPALAGLGVALLGLLMVSPVPYRSFKEHRVRRSWSNTVLMVIAFAVILSEPAVTLALIGVVYVASGPIEWWWRRRTGRPLVETGAGGAAEAARRGGGGSQEAAP